MVNNAFGKSFTTFRDETMHKVSMFKWVPKRDGYDKARELLTPSIRFDIKDVWDGPEMTTQQREVELTAQQKKLMADLKKDLQVTLKEGKPITATNEAAARTKFIQISLGAIYDQNHKTHLIDAKPRLDELKAVLEQAPGKCLVFVPLTSVVDFLYKELSGNLFVRGGQWRSLANESAAKYSTTSRRRPNLASLLLIPALWPTVWISMLHRQLFGTVLPTNRKTLPASQQAGASPRPEVPRDRGAACEQPVGTRDLPAP